MRVMNCIHAMVSDIKNIDHKYLESFLNEDLNDQFILFEEVYEKING